MSKFGLGEVIEKIGGNNRPVRWLKFITTTENPDVIRLLEILHQQFMEKNVIFDPLKLF